MTNDCARPLGDVLPPPWHRPIGAGGRGLLDLLLRRGSAAQSGLPRLLDLSQPSVARLVGGFAAEGLIAATPRVATGRGNPSTMLALVPDHAFGLGVGITGDAISMALVDLTGVVRAQRCIAMIDRSRSAVVASLAGLRADVIEAAGIDPDRIVGTGVGFSGFLVGDPPRFNPPRALPDWVDVDLLQTLRPALGSSLLCDNDATCAAIAEGLLGVGRTTATFAYCHLTNGFGGGLVVDGKPMRGARGNAGDFGGVWWLLGRNRPYASYPGLDRLHALVAREGRPFATVEDMLNAIDPSTPGVDAWLAEAQDPFATLAFLLGHIVAPSKVVIGGRLPTWLARSLAEAVDLPASPPRHDRPFPLPSVVASEITGDAPAIGAALLPLQALFFR
ncbi:ROK family protein [Sphingomonas sp. 2R-10]|uniref:ROK family protein n=1 Tax=Sphingomonas sp. 2R-10 TaxID=3045148 RepID=UPI000F78977C|nr:ROK family protein [Sphingomonas sp. 2R-10]MDJ0278917.1 ROK family protein [Sphingomonas sp. 2R-10]